MGLSETTLRLGDEGTWGKCFPFHCLKSPWLWEEEKALGSLLPPGRDRAPPPPPPSPPRMTQWEREGKRETLPHAKKLNGEAVPPGRGYCRAGSAQRSIGGRGRRLPLRLSHLPSQGVGGRSVRWEVGGHSTVRYLKIEHCDTQI